MNYLVIGGTSRIAVSAMKNLVKQDDKVCFVGRNAEELSRISGDFSVRHGIKGKTLIADIENFNEAISFCDEVMEWFGDAPDLILVASGVLGDQDFAKQDFRAFQEIINTNFLGICAFIMPFIEHMKKRNSGQVAVLSSVAGDRGRQSNYPYGAAKSAINAYLAGLRNQLSAFNVNVITLKLGFIDTQMTHKMSGKLLMIQPEKAGQLIANAVKSKKDIVYVPGIWFFVMTIIKNIPESIFKRLSL